MNAAMASSAGGQRGDPEGRPAEVLAVRSDEAAWRNIASDEEDVDLTGMVEHQTCFVRCCEPPFRLAHDPHSNKRMAGGKATEFEFPRFA